jgi:CBS domain protein
MDRTVWISIAVFVGILVLLMLLRGRNANFEIKATDIVVAVLPIVIFLLITGKIQRFEVGELKIETAFVKASNSAIASQVTPLIGLPSEPIRIDPKMGVEQIPRLIKDQAQGLSFRLGFGGYYGPAIRDYLVVLTKQPFLRYIIIQNPDGTFFAMADARALADQLTSLSSPPPFTADDLANWLNSADKTSLKRLPGFIGSESAVSDTTDKAQALQRMESLNVDTLPVVDKGKRFVGIVNRSRLTASLILEVANDLKK